MSIIDTQTEIRHIKCDGTGCTNEILFDKKDAKSVFEDPKNAWIKTTRVTQTGDGRNYAYCSDICEVEGIKTGKHNVQEQPKVAPAATPADLASAIAMAKARAEADAAIRAGQPVNNIQIADK